MEVSSHEGSSAAADYSTMAEFISAEIATGTHFSLEKIRKSERIYNKLRRIIIKNSNASGLLIKPLLEGRVTPRPLYGRRGSRPSKKAICQKKLMHYKIYPITPIIPIIK